MVNQDPLKIYLISKQGQNFFNGPLVYGLLLLLTLTTVHWNSAHIAHIMSSYKTKLCHFSLCYNHNTSQISTSSRRVQGHKLCQVFIHLQNLGSSQLANHLVNEINLGPSCYVNIINNGPCYVNCIAYCRERNFSHSTNLSTKQSKPLPGFQNWFAIGWSMLEFLLQQFCGDWCTCHQ